jgi:hypothetical protein
MSLDHRQSEMIRNVLRLSYDEQIPAEVLNCIEMCEIIARAAGVRMQWDHPASMIMMFMMCPKAQTKSFKSGDACAIISQPDQKVRYIAPGPVNTAIVEMNGEKWLLRMDELSPFKSERLQLAEV